MEHAKHQDLIAQLLKNRGIDDEDQFFSPPYYDAQSRDPFLIPGVDEAVKRLLIAHDEQQKIVIYGDYDIDGLTATTLLEDAFSAFGYEVATYTPDRFSEGYGLNRQALTTIKQDLKAALVVTVDCGTVSFKELEHAEKIGLDVIVTDHHQPQATLPPAVAIVNPHRADNQYPFDQFAGVGVAFKLIQALQTKLDGLGPGQEKWLLDLVALGTVCDVVPLVDENRSLVYWGLQVLANTRRKGLVALMEVSGVEKSAVAAQDLGFRLGPRLNSSGRLTHAKRSLALLTSSSNQDAQVVAQELHQLNSRRRILQQTVLAEAIAQAEEQASSSVLVVANEGWNEGVIGIVAARLLEEFGKPSFVFAIDGAKAKASARSYGDFSAVEAIRAAADVTTSGGGHHAAGGCSVAAKDIAEFTKIVNEFYDQQQLNIDQQRTLLKPKPELTLDNFELLSPQLLEVFQTFEPFGQDNPQPIVALGGRLVDQKLVGQQKNHLKIMLEDDQKQQIGGILFGRSELLDKPTTYYGYLTATNYHSRGVELIIKDFT